ncbi:Holliday junction resolvase [Caldalkalibacillus thermarum TA2.A1]|uniref:Putative pre-16S rRNA nuclease n=1 Tax=Caldalkalibacillus thermarum (strain TA2.A1) TaxID=986075 RepID=F5L574_CALTT|nr:Holliday junction resolvase RuvX [Caldalkalibacillus thermarum]EGL83504.1 Holliday junction resolvase [Caldalkalibacillus thermarum TA2.A1]QZT33461.1 Holliday junction resolvase RuvX [Caldalkalibacillus thermarum TA2.A1]GGK16383.1 putative pre-16S rRNA nuclease [Caldalkalibacillus thermarum]
MRIMGLDVGQKTIGVSVSDELGWTAQGIEVIKRTDLQRDLARLEELIAEYQVGQIIVGLPKNMDGTIGETGTRCQAFAQVLREKTGLPVEMWDERLSTKSAERILLSADMSRKKRKQVIDKMAAVIMLQSYLDAKTRSR